MLGLAVLLPSVWLDTSLTGSDEYNITFPTTLETTISDDWTIPTLAGEPRLRKPPLYYWLLATSNSLFGSSPLALRFWGVLAGTLLAIFTAMLGQRCCGANPTLTFVILISTIGLATESRRAMLDIPMAFLVICSIERIVCWKSSGGVKKAAFSGGLLGLAMLIKPTAILFGFTGLISLLLFGPKRSPSARLVDLVFFALGFLLLAAPWWLLVADRYPELLQQRWQEQIAHRELSWIHIEAIPSLLGGVLGLIVPWSFIAIAALFSFLKKKSAGLETPERWLAIWVILSIVPFLFIKTFERYLIPILPVMAILVSSYLETLGHGARKKHLLIATFLIGIPCLFIAGFVGWFHCSLHAAYLVTGAWVIMLLVSLSGSAISSALAGAGLLSLVMGVALPSIGIGALPRFPDACKNTNLTMVGSQIFPTLPLRQGKLIPTLPVDPELLASSLPPEKTTLIVRDKNIQGLTQALEISAREARKVATFGAFQSRKTFVRFPRPDVTDKDWKTAIQNRSLDSLRIPCSIYLLEAATP
jgi:4-amino-4-deoxy-L-arabinose transferase-like glycosyltransferase